MSESVRVAIVRQLPQYLACKGIDLAEFLDATGVAANAFESEDNRLQYPELERVLLEVERRTGLDDIGLELGRHTRLRDFGLAGELALCANTAGEGLGQFIEYFNLHSTATLISLLDQGDHVRFVYAISTAGLKDTRHFQSGAAVVGINVLRDLFGPRWRPLSVEVACRAPRSHKAFERYFDGRTHFDAPATAVHFEHRWLETALAQVDERRRQELQAVARARLEAMREDWPVAVRRLARKQMLAGRFSMDDVARMLGVHRRTLDRHLDDYGLQYGGLVEATRHEVASQLLRETSLPVQRIAETLHYSSAANFATAFRRLEGITPTEYRRRHAGA